MHAPVLSRVNEILSRRDATYSERTPKHTTDELLPLSPHRSYPDEKCYWYAWRQRCGPFITYLSDPSANLLGEVAMSSDMVEFQTKMDELGDAGYHMHSVSYGDGTWLAYFRKQPRSYSWVVRPTLEEFQAACEDHAERGYRATAFAYGDGVYLGWFQKMLTYEMNKLRAEGRTQHRVQLLDGWDELSSATVAARRNKEAIVAALAVDGPKFLVWLEASTDVTASDPGSSAAYATDHYTFLTFVHDTFAEQKWVNIPSFFMGKDANGRAAMYLVKQRDWPDTWNDLVAVSASNSDSGWMRRTDANEMYEAIQSNIELDERGYQWCITSLEYGCMPEFG